MLICHFLFPFPLLNNPWTLQNLLNSAFTVHTVTFYFPPFHPLLLLMFIPPSACLCHVFAECLELALPDRIQKINHRHLREQDGTSQVILEVNPLSQSRGITLWIREHKLTSLHCTCLSNRRSSFTLQPILATPA